jgi:hypothetical protein
MLLLHVVSAEVILALIPFSRMSHFVLSPSRRIAAARTGRAFGAVEPRRKREEVTP